ncbi:MAG: D-alanyl-D-alanine carboxypeptidase [Lachnospiraceae bacterium]|nr:D-alanyl-D-alanine carboxypeptidase [Lachnospiraceae bacterium]
MSRTRYKRKLLSVAAYVLIAALFTSTLCGCGGNDEATELMGSYAAADNVINYDVGAMQEASFAPMLSQWFICDITEDMMNRDYVFDPDNTKLERAAAFVINRSTNELLFGYNMLTPVYPASVTKLLTTLVVLRECDLKDTVTIDAEIAAMKRGSVAELNEGDVITVYNLLVLVLTSSANNAAMALAKYVAGSEDAFVEKMNQVMDDLGVNNTNFLNASGLHLAKHMTTAYDMYIVYQECTMYSAFRDIMKLTEGEYDYTNANGERGLRPYFTTNCFKPSKEREKTKNSRTYPLPEGFRILGGKTGTTDYAGYCLILHVADAEGTEYILGAFHCATEEKLYTKMYDLIAQYCKPSE